MDKVFSIGGALAVVGIVLMAAWLFSGGIFADSPRSVVRGLEGLGGPLGLWGGIALLAAVGVGVYILHEAANYRIGAAMIRRLKRRGHPPDVIAAQIDFAPVSRGLKRRLKSLL